MTLPPLLCRSRTTYRFLLEESVSSDTDTVLTVPNVLPLTGMLKDEVRGQSDFVKRSVVWPLLEEGGTEVFTVSSVAELLWGRHDERACLGDEDEEEDPFGDDDWMSFGQESESDDDRSRRHRRPSYRRADGRCMFGILAHRNATLGAPTTILTGVGEEERRRGSPALERKGLILTHNSRSELGVWQEGSRCDSLDGANEITALPPLQTEPQDEDWTEQQLQVFVGIMCRYV